MDDSYTHVVILNTAMPIIDHIPKENVIGFAFEPPEFLNLTKEFISYARKHIGIYCIGSAKGLPKPFCEKFGFLMHRNPKARSNRKIMSLMISNKLHAPGHKYRHQIAQLILQTDLPVDIWGKGCRYYSSCDDRIKGEFGQEVIINTDYKYHIAIENFQHPAYVSEKIIDSIYCGTIPIYLGAPIMDDYCIKLTGDLDKDMQIIKDICDGNNKQPQKYLNDFKIEFDFVQTLLDYLQ